jgi:hypothetical protein
VLLQIPLVCCPEKVHGDASSWAGEEPTRMMMQEALLLLSPVIFAQGGKDDSLCKEVAFPQCCMSFEAHGMSSWVQEEGAHQAWHQGPLTEPLHLAPVAALIPTPLRRQLVGLSPWIASSPPQ